ncbi:MAG: hypothetical protein WBS19_13480, partial [Candidatus Korobacteraceae bacterium]
MPQGIGKDIHLLRWRSGWVELRLHRLIILRRSVMADPFASSRSKLAWAEKRLNDLEGEISDFVALQPYARVAEPHPDKPDHVVHKIRLTKSPPEHLTNIVGEVVDGLRSALDTAGYSVALAVAPPGTDPKHTAFPFARTAAQMANALGRSKDVPPQIQSLFCGFQPYLGGDDLLWALNEICNTNKHKIVVPIGNGAIRSSAMVKGTGFFSMPDPHVWNRAKNEMEIITLGPGAKYDYDFNFALFIA